MTSEATNDRYVQAIRSHGKWKVLQKFGPGVLAFACESRGLMTKADADELARHIANDGTGFAYLKPERN